MHHRLPLPGSQSLRHRQPLHDLPRGPPLSTTNPSSTLNQLSESSPRIPVYPRITRNRTRFVADTRSRRLRHVRHCPPVTFNLYQVGSLQRLANFRIDEGQPPPALSPVSNRPVQSKPTSQDFELAVNSPIATRHFLPPTRARHENFLSFPNSLISTSQQQAPLRLTPVNRLVGLRGPQNASRRCDCSLLASRKVHSLQLSVTSLRPDTEANDDCDTPFLGLGVLSRQDPNFNPPITINMTLQVHGLSRNPGRILAPNSV
ncbi:hypothetical protein K456DRAFT_1598985 [Colletotrichum gloeosporioides 23]|nr:hypothetical protein K456DRAFT_1598985 [Colletotrichum gloeosporioides 23]